MKKFSLMGSVCALFVVLTMSLSPLLMAASPIQPWITGLHGVIAVDRAGNTTLIDAGSATTGVFPKGVARFIYDTAVHGLTNTAHGLGVYLPAGAVIVRSYFKIITQFSDSGTTTLALSCEDANNIKTATDITGSSANAFVEGESTGAASAFQRAIGAQCEITATPAGAANNVLLGGKLVGWVEYVMEN